MSKSIAIRRILLAYDASAEADHAFEYARVLARRFDAGLEVLYVIARPIIVENVELSAILEEGKQKAEQSLRRLRHVTQGEDLSIQFLTRFGRPLETILARAHEVDADLIVVGHRRRSLLERRFARSTALKILQRAGCPVLMVP